MLKLYQNCILTARFFCSAAPFCGFRVHFRQTGVRRRHANNERPMIARLLQFFLVLQVLAAAACAALWATLWPAAPCWFDIVLGVLCVLLLRLLITAQNFTLSYCYRSQTPTPFALPWRARCRMFATECSSSLLASSWSMAWPAPVCGPANTGTIDAPVLLVHGYGCNRGYWSQLSVRLTGAGIEHQALDLAPPGVSIDDFVPQLAAAITRLCLGEDRQVILVAHSMGGLVARAYLRMHGAARVARLITLATPHHGTVLARFGIGVSARQMRRHGAGAHAVPSDWLVALAGSETVARRALITSLYSHHDNIVAPQTSAVLDGARNIAFAGIGHVAMGRSPSVLQCVLTEIADVNGDGAAPAR